jgi:hypothetical protein
MAKLVDPTSCIPKSSYDPETQDTHHFTHAFSIANTNFTKDSEVSLFEIEMKRHKIISIIEIESEKANSKYKY